MAISTYGELQTAAANWLVRGDLAARVPEFIALAEAKLSRTLRVRQMVGRDQADISDAFVSLPPDFLEMRSLILSADGEAHALAASTPETLAAWAAEDSTAARPRFYALVGSQLQLHPAPDRAYAAVITFFQKAPALSDVYPSNWLLAAAPDIYLYGTLLEAAPYLRDGEALATWRALLAEAVGLLKEADRRPVGTLRTDFTDLDLGRVA